MPRHDVVIIGAGPGGYVAAIRAAQLGFDVACIEREEALGGTCVRVGCIPSKALLVSSERFREAREDLGEHGIGVDGLELDLGAMMARKDRVVKANSDGVTFLLKKNGVTCYQGSAEIVAPGRVVIRDGETMVEAEHTVIATGSRVAPLSGIEPDGDRIVTSSEALAFSEVPEHLAVIGAGYIGLELGLVWHRLGARVTVLEYLERILPGMDAEIAGEALKAFKKRGLEFHLGARVTGARTSGNRVSVEVEGADKITCDRLLLAVGRLPNTDGLGLERLGVEVGERGQIEVDERFRTSVPGIYAIGDVVRGPMLAHKAEEEGVALAEWLKTGVGRVNYAAIPGIVYTEPEIAAVGQTEERLKEEGVSYRKGSFPFSANGRARTEGVVEGRVKILAHAETDRILGVHIIGAGASDLIAEAVMAIEFGASAEDIARSVHAHPTLAEAVKEAALAVDGRSLHL